MAACQATKEAIWLRQLLEKVGEDVSSPVPIYIDNQSAIKLIHNPEFHNRSKHIDVQFHFIREKYQKKEIEPVYISTKLQEADILTKALARPRFCYLRQMLELKSMDII